MATTRIEAESMTLAGYSAEYSAVSSGNQVIKTDSNGSASTQFAGTPGLYDLKVAYHDENDGAATLSLWVDGQRVDIWSMNAATDSAIATTGNLRTRTVTGINLKANSVIRIAGTQAGNEFARVDYLDIVGSNTSAVPVSSVPASNATPTSNSVTVNSAGITLQPNISVGVARIESHDMSRTGYDVEASSISSGGQVVNTSGTGIASASFSGAAGSYTLKVGYYDENDGQARLTVKVDGITVSSWVLNESTSSSVATTENFRERVLSGIALDTNSVIEIIGSKAGNEFARLDYLEIEVPTTTTPVVETTTTVNSTGVTLPPGISVGVGRIESDAMTRTGYNVEASSISSGGNVVNAASTGIASAKFSGTTGNYDLKVGYYDENDGESTLTVKVDGVTVSSWVLNESTSSSIATTGSFRERVLSGVALNTNSVIEIIGTQEGNEFARLDYLDVAIPGTTTTPVGGVNTFQAEDALLSGAFVDSLNGGAQGGKYADYKNANNDFIEWTVNVAADSNYDLTWRYANGASNRPLSFTVNGAVSDANLAFNGTGSWNTWNTTTKTVALKAGANKIRLQANGSSGANFDYLQVSPGGSVPPSGGSGASSKKIKVLALGDSNTRGEGTPGGYRTQFWNRAVNDGVAIDFLGTRNGGPSNLGDKDHQGQGGWSIPQMLSWVKAGNLANQNPDMILFMMGTNDANTNGAVSGAAIRDRLSTFIDEVSKVVPKAHLFVSSILPLDTPRGTAAEAKAARDFNSLIPGLVSQKAAQGKRVSFVNAGGSLGVGDVNGDNSATNDQNDGLHATASGYNKLGDAWYNGVRSSNVWQQAVASQSGSANAIESDAVTNSLSGNNIIQSAAGADGLTGGGGADAFVYQNPGAGLDRILDFDGDDVLRISASGFGGDLVAGSSLGSDDYVLGSNPSAVDGGATFLYNTGSKTLSFDADGTGSGTAVSIASFTNGFTPAASQIEIFA